MGNTVDQRAARRSVSAMTFMTHPMPYLTSHAWLRSAQRNMALDAVRYILTYGREVRRTGVTFFILARRDIPTEDLRLPWIARLEGSVALVARDGAIITLYRNPAAIRAILRKARYESRPSRGSRARRDERIFPDLCMDGPDTNESMDAAG